MTVGELRALLADLPDDAPVVVDGMDQCGYDVPNVSGVVLVPSGVAGRIPGDFVDAEGRVEGAFAAVCISGDTLGLEASYAEALAAVEVAR